MTTKAEYDRAYLEGVTARQSGMPLSANPYKHRGGRDGELLWDRWIDGWRDQDKASGRANG